MGRSRWGRGAGGDRDRDGGDGANEEEVGGGVEGLYVSV